MMLRESIRQDGLRVITKKLSWYKKFRLCFVVGSGSASEPPEFDGLFHLLEHMIFRGTKRQTFLKIWEQAERFLYVNGETAKTHTNFSVEAVYPQFALACDFLCDLFLNSVLPEALVAKEKKIIAQIEIPDIRDDDEDESQLELCKLLWGRGPQAKFGGGSMASFRKIDRGLLVETYRKFYIPSNTTVIGVGKLDHDKLARMIFEAFPFRRSRVKTPDWNVQFTERPAKKLRVISKLGRTQSVVNIGVKLPPFDDRGRAILTSLIFMLRFMLWQKLRVTDALCYAVDAVFTGSSKLGYYFSFLFTVPQANEEEAIKKCREIICEMPLSRDVFKIQKEAVDHLILVSQETLSDWEDLILDRILGEGRPLSFLDNYESGQRALNKKITFEEVENLRSSLLKLDRLACVVIRPK